MVAVAVAALSDAPALAAIHARAFPLAEAWDEAAIGELLASPGCVALWFPEEAFLLLRFVADEFEILTLATRPESRRRGLARALLEEGLEACRRYGIRTQFLEVSTQNDAARGLYAALGFTETGRRRKYYANGADALILRFSPCVE